jgi:hypothetical protein
VLRPSDARVRRCTSSSTVNPSSTAKTKCRTPKQQPATPSPAAEHINQAALAEAGASLSAHAQHLAVVDKKFGDIVEYQRDRVVSEAKFFVNQASESFFEAGKRLLLLKEHEEHGEFLKALERIGIDDSTRRSS